MKADILIVDDESDIRGLIRGILEDEGYATRQASNAEQAIALVGEKAPDVMILDVWLQGGDQDGLEVLKETKSRHPHLPILMISGHGTIETAVSAIKQGAYDFIEKPFKADRMILMIQRALEAAQLRRENMSLRLKAEGPSEIIGDSPIVSALRQNIARVAQTNSRVFLTGEPGTGKDVAARVLHRLSSRGQGAFMSLNCAILQPEHLETELFGSEDETGLRKGVLEQAHGGTLLLDEVSDMPLETQGKIVRVLQEQKFHRVGGSTPVEVNVRIIASTNRDLSSLIAQGKFRQDLFYRLNVVPITMPPLRERRQDIPGLVAFFADRISAQSGLPVRKFSDGALATLQSYEWPGNVRQLKNVVEWVMIMNGGEGQEPVRSDQLPPEISNLKDDTDSPELSRMIDLISFPLREAREVFERDYLLSQIRRFGGNISKTAEFVGMERSALHRKLKQLGVGEAKQGAETDAESDGDRKIA